MRQVWLLVRREFREKMRSRVFIGTNLFLVVLVVLGVALPAFLSDDGPETVRVGTVGDQAAAVAELATAQAEAFEYDLEVEQLADEQAARSQLEDDGLDVALAGDGRLLSLDSPDDSLVRLLETAERGVRLDAALAEAGIAAERRTELLAGGSLAVEVLDEDAADEPEAGAVFTGIAMVFVLYGLLIFYGQQVAQGLVQEKQSRVIEVLLASVRPMQLLGGKLLGLGLLGLVQIVGLGATAVVALLVTGSDVVPPAAVPTVVAGAIWFIGGYALYATIFALTAAVVPKVEDLQSALGIPIMLLVGSLFVAQFALANPDGVVATIGGLLPPVAPIYQPLTVALGTATPLGMGLAALGVVATTAALVPFTARVHAGAALATRRRISIREAMRRSAE